MSRYHAPLPPHRDPSSRIAARFRRHELRAMDAAKAAEHVRETGELSDEHRKPSATAAGDPEKLRGFPVIGHGVGGTQRGTDPYHETARRDAQRRRQLERTAL